MDTINLYKQQLKKAEDILSFEQVDAILDKVPINHPKLTNRKTAFVWSSALVFISLTIFGVWQASHNKPLKRDSMNEDYLHRSEHPAISQNSIPNPIIIPDTQTTKDLFDDFSPNDSVKEPVRRHDTSKAVEPVIVQTPAIQPNRTIDKKQRLRDHIDPSNAVSPINQLKQFGLYVYDDVVLFSHASPLGSTEIYIDGQGTFSHSNRGTIPKAVRDQELPVVISAPGTLIYQHEDWDSIRLVNSQLQGIRVNYPLGRYPYTVWWFDKTIVDAGSQDDVFSTATLSLEDILADSSSLRKLSYVHHSAGKTLYFDQQFIRASKDMIKKLNIRFNENTIHYKKGLSEFRGKHASSYSDVHRRYTHRYMKNTPPSFITREYKHHTEISEFISSNNRENDSRQFFYANKHRMVAVSIGEIQGCKIVFWYENLKRLNDILEQAQARQVEEYMSYISKLNLAPSLPQKINTESYLKKMLAFSKIGVSTSEMLDLSPKTLKKLGIMDDQGYVRYNLNIGKWTEVNYTFHKDDVELNLRQNNVETADSIIPAYVTDGLGHLYRLSFLNAEDYQVQNLVPVYVKSDYTYHLSDNYQNKAHPDCIFWFVPSNAFLSLLPDEVADQIRNELLMYKANEEKGSIEPDSTPCVYFNSCEIEEAGFNYTVYPNPTQSRIFVQFDSNWVAGKIRVFSLSGELLHTHEVKGKLEAIDLSALASGVYYLEATSLNQKRLSKRIFISR